MIVMASIVTTCVIALVLLDLFGIHRGHTRPTARSEWRTFGLYAALACAFAGFLWVAYDQRFLGLGSAGLHGVRMSGREAATQFIGAFVWQLALDLDTVFVVTALFVQFKTPREVQHRVLLWGILLGLAVRGALTAAGAAVLAEFWWSRYVLSGLLVLAALRMLLIRQETFDPAANPLISALRRFIPVAERAEGAALFTRMGGRLSVTPLLILVVLLETADAFMALDSVPAVLAVSREPLLVFSANAFALLGLRTLYVALQNISNWLRYVKIGLACSIGYAAVLMALPAAHRPSTIESVIVLLVSMGAGLIIGVGTKPTPESMSPLGAEAERVATTTLRHAKRGIALVLGITLILLGVLMVILPGPGLPIVFIGLAVLGNEFAWARRLLVKYRHKAEEAVHASANAARKRLRPWVLIPLVLGTIAAFVLVGRWFHFGTTQVLLGLIPAVAGQLLWGYLAFFRRQPEKGGTP